MGTSCRCGRKTLPARQECSRCWNIRLEERRRQARDIGRTGICPWCGAALDHIADGWQCGACDFRCFTEERDR